MEKLTPAQIEKLSVVLAFQFVGKQIAFGNKYGYNMDQIYQGTLTYSHQTNHMFLTDAKEISNKVFGKSVKKIKCFDKMQTPYNQYHAMYTINISKLLIYVNGQEVITKALEIVKITNK